MFTEDDFMYEHSSIKDSAAELLSVLKDYTRINYIRFNKRNNIVAVFDNPCITEDRNLPIPMTKTAGFSNNAHICRVDAVQRLFQLVHDAGVSGKNWGLECYHQAAR